MNTGQQRAGSGSPFDEELDVELVVRADGSLAEPVSGLASMEGALKKVGELRPEDLTRLLAAMRTESNGKMQPPR